MIEAVNPNQANGQPVGKYLAFVGKPLGWLLPGKKFRTSVKMGLLTIALSAGTANLAVAGPPCEDCYVPPLPPGSVHPLFQQPPMPWNSPYPLPIYPHPPGVYPGAPSHQFDSPYMYPPMTMPPVSPQTDPMKDPKDEKSKDDDSTSSQDQDNTNNNQNNLPDNPQQNNQPNINNNNAQNNMNTQTAQAPQTQSSAAPNMIGDFREAPFFYTNGFNNVTLPQQGIVRLDFSQNTNPIPVDRVYMNYHHYRNAYSAQAGIIGNDFLFFGTISGPGPGGVADQIFIETISAADFDAIDTAAGSAPATAAALSALFGFEVFNPTAFLSSDDLAADGFDSANLDVFYLGIEKTFFQDRSSVELRLPILSAPNQDLDARDDNLQSLNGYHIQMGNISLLLKSLIMRDYTGTFTVSGGLGFTVPSGPDFRIRDADVLIPDQNNVDDITALANRGFTPDNYVVAPSEFLVPGGSTGRLIRLPGNDITVRNRALLLTPFLAFTQQMTPKLSTQLYFQGDFVASDNTISTPSGEVAKIKQQDIFKVDYQLKYWFFRKPDLINPRSSFYNGSVYRQSEGVHFKGLAGLFELHGTTALSDPDGAGTDDLLDDPTYLSGDYDINTLVGTNNNGDQVNLTRDRFFASSNNARRLRSLNVTGGMQIDLADGGNVTFAAAVPLVEQAPGVNLFDVELIFQYNMFY